MLKPRGVEVAIFDYDVDGCDENRLSKDLNGHPCIIRELKKSQLIECEDD